MALVTVDEVKAVVTTTLTDDAIQLWIEAADAMVNRYASCIGGDESLLTKVELYLSSHFVELDGGNSLGPITKTKLDVLETTYASVAQEKDSIGSTRYGKTADMLAGGCFSRYDEDIATVEFF